MARKKRKKKSKAQRREERQQNVANLRYHKEQSKKRQVQSLLILLLSPPAIIVGAILWAHAPQGAPIRSGSRIPWQVSLGSALVVIGVFSLVNLFFPFKDDPPDRDDW